MSRLFERPDCKLCEQLKKMQNKQPPCDTCTPPLLPENRAIVDVYLQCFNQLIIAPMGGVIDINIQAVDIAVKRHKGLKDPDMVFQAVINLARQRIKKEKENNV